MHEELVSHWSRARVVAEETHGDRKLVVLRAPSEIEHEVHGMAQCSITRGSELEGVFWIRWRPEGKTLDGYLCPNLDDMYGFPARPTSQAADWPDLLAFAKRVIDFDYRFPQELDVTHQITGLASKIRKPNR